MRTIKFRAWEVNLKEMIHVDDIQFRNNEIIKIDGIELHPKEDQPVMINTKSAWRIVDEDDAILMQYTGLKDKDGKEIYEGDIVKDCDTSDMHFEVKWDEDKLGYYMPTEFDEEYVYSLNTVKLEIIGNIYEHGDLLK